MHKWVNPFLVFYIEFLGWWCEARIDKLIDNVLGIIDTEMTCLE